MLSRILEPEVMDSLEEAEAYDAMDHSEVNSIFVDDLRSVAEAGQLTGRILDVGTGTALIPIELCRQVPDFRIIGIDLSRSMLDVGQANVQAANLAARISLELVDAKQMPYDDGEFAAVISNSIVHHIPQPHAVFSEAVRVTAPGGILFFRDLLRPPDDAAVKRLVRAYAGNETEMQRKLFDDSLRASLSLHEVRELVGGLGFDPMSVRTSSDRHWTWAARKSAIRNPQSAILKRV